MQLGVLQGDGAPLRTHLQRLRRATRKLDPMLAASLAELPPLVAHIWQAFVVLSQSRGEGSIAFSEIEAWQRLAGIRLTPWEFETLLAMDAAALRTIDQVRSQRKDVSQ